MNGKPSRSDRKARHRVNWRRRSCKRARKWEELRDAASMYEDAMQWKGTGRRTGDNNNNNNNRRLTDRQDTDRSRMDRADPITGIGRCYEKDRTQRERREEERAYRAGFLEKAMHGKVEEAGAAKKLRRAAAGGKPATNARQISDLRWARSARSVAGQQETRAAERDGRSV